MSTDRDPQANLINAKTALLTIAVLTLIACAPALIIGAWKWMLAL